MEGGVDLACVDLRERNVEPERTLQGWVGCVLGLGAERLAQRIGRLPSFGKPLEHQRRNGWFRGPGHGLVPARGHGPTLRH